MQGEAERAGRAGSAVGKRLRVGRGVRKGAVSRGRRALRRMRS
ncbi:hypothetical protein ACFPRL_18215 [Pseudoclavibacter helvolus]